MLGLPSTLRNARITPFWPLTDMPANGNREDYVRSVLEPESDDGSTLPRVTPFGKQDSSMLATLARANGL
jgi:molybdopterin molybdotransferase